MTKTTSTSTKADRKTANVAAHQARLATAKAEGAERRAKIAEGRAVAHRALLDGRRDEAAKAKAARIQGHQDRIEASKADAAARKAANDVAEDAVAA